MPDEINPLLQLTPLSQCESDEEPLTVENFDIEINSLNDLARIDTTAIDELKNRNDIYLSRMREFVLDDSDGIRAMLDYIDARIGDDQTVNQFDLAAVRDSVRAIMTTLRAHPEYSGILLDKDIGNIVNFARETHRASLEMHEMTRVKAAAKPKAKSKAALRAGRLEKHLASLDSMLKGLK